MATRGLEAASKRSSDCSTELFRRRRFPNKTAHFAPGFPCYDLLHEVSRCRDPKGLSEDRTLLHAKPAPCGTSVDDTIITLRAGHCVQCGKAYSMGELIGRNQTASHSVFSPKSDGYCLDCWRSIHEETR
jgi:hypothetical protein